MKVLVCNVGSTSLKFKLYDMPAEHVQVQAYVERVGSVDNAIYTYTNWETGEVVKKDGLSVPSYTEGIQLFLEDLQAPQPQK